mmetsp:Transcript_4709/g.8561  ORF Transcript_4709/g.8561 Transcript_4709/m.8561 type:complete len:330 (+) Transcript_4709:413-1402(+)
MQECIRLFCQRAACSVQRPTNNAGRWSSRATSRAGGGLPLVQLGVIVPVCELPLVSVSGGLVSIRDSAQLLQLLKRGKRECLCKSAEPFQEVDEAPSDHALSVPKLIHLSRLRPDEQEFGLRGAYASAGADQLQAVKKRHPVFHLKPLGGGFGLVHLVEGLEQGVVGLIETIHGLSVQALLAKIVTVEVPARWHLGQMLVAKHDDGIACVAREALTLYELGNSCADENLYPFEAHQRIVVVLVLLLRRHRVALLVVGRDKHRVERSGAAERRTLVRDAHLAAKGTPLVCQHAEANFADSTASCAVKVKRGPDDAIATEYRVMKLVELSF